MPAPVDAETAAAVEQLQRAYADISTRGAWDEVDAIFTPDAHIRFHTSSGGVFDIEGARAFGEFGAKMTGFAFFLYIPANWVVHWTDDGTLEGRTHSMELAETEEGEWVEAFSVYDDRYARVDGRWRFAARTQRTVKRRVTPAG